MKITKQRLKQIISEEIDRAIIKEYKELDALSAGDHVIIRVSPDGYETSVDYADDEDTKEALEGDFEESQLGRTPQLLALAKIIKIGNQDEEMNESLNECARCGRGCGCGGVPQVTDNQRLMDIENLFMQIQDVIDQMDDPMIGREVLQSMVAMPVGTTMVPEEPLEE
jgi:hypothetical protein